MIIKPVRTCRRQNDTHHDGGHRCRGKDGPENGNRKLVPIIARQGEGLEGGDYINVLMRGAYAKLEEGMTAYELEDGGSDDDETSEEDIAF